MQSTCILESTYACGDTMTDSAYCGRYKNGNVFARLLTGNFCSVLLDRVKSSGVRPRPSSGPMASFSSHSIPQRANGYPEKTRLAGGLPTYSSAVQEKMHRHTRSMSWTVPVSVPIPGVRTRRLRLFMPNPTRMQQLGLSRFSRRRGPLIICLLLLASVCTFFSFARKFGPEEKQWTPNFGESSTLVFGREDIQRIWKWEISSGHYPSKRESKSSECSSSLPFL